MFGYVYKITNTLDGKIYVGIHKSETFDDKYWGSGSNLQEAKKTYGLSSFTRCVLQWCSTQEELHQQEKYWIDKLDARNPDVGYNIQPGGVRVVGYKLRPETKRRISDRAKLRPPQYWINNGVTESLIPKTHPVPDGWMTGRLPEVMKRAGDAHRGKKVQDTSRLHKAKGKHWYTNGTEDIMSYTCPEGFTSGRSNIPDISGENNPMYGKLNPRKGAHLEDSTKLLLSEKMKKNNLETPRRWITDGKVEMLAPKSLSIPGGFVRGRLRRTK